MHLHVQVAHRPGLCSRQNHQLLLQVKPVFFYPVVTLQRFCSVKLKTLLPPPLSDGQGHSYDLSPLALDSGNWEVQHPTGDASPKIYINVCRSLVQMGGACLFVSSGFSALFWVSHVFYFL